MSGAPAPVKSRAGAWAGLVTAALLWGLTFVIVKEALDEVSVFAFLGWRFLLGAAVMLPLSWPRGRAVWRDGAWAGLVLFAGFSLQTWGLQLTTAGNSGLITGLYVVFTPLFLAAMARRLPPRGVLLGAFLAFAGLVLLAWPEQWQLQSGDLLTVGCAAAFGVHFVMLSAWAPRHAALPFTSVQLLVVAVLSLLISGGLEGLPFPPSSSWTALIICGLAAGAGGFFLQVRGQAVVGAVPAAIVVSLESPFAVIFGAFLLGERLGALGWIGAVLILAGMHVVLRAGDPHGEAEECPPPA